MMDGNKLEELRELVEFLKANGIAEFDMEQDDLKVRIKFAGEPAAAGGVDLTQLSRLMASALSFWLIKHSEQHAFRYSAHSCRQT